MTRTSRIVPALLVAGLAAAWGAHDAWRDRSMLIVGTDAGSDAELVFQGWVVVLMTIAGIIGFTSVVTAKLGARPVRWHAVQVVVHAAFALTILTLGSLAFWEPYLQVETAAATVTAYALLSVGSGALYVRHSRRLARADESRGLVEIVIGAALACIAVACGGLLLLAVLAVTTCGDQCTGGAGVLLILSLLLLPGGLAAAWAARRLLRPRRSGRG